MVALLLSAALLASDSRTDDCREVVGTYEIYANHDLLRISGSHHFIEVTSATLDTELQRRGWENTLAHGRFTICGPGIGKPQDLNMQDRLTLRSWTDVRFEHRKPDKR